MSTPAHDRVTTAYVLGRRLDPATIEELYRLAKDSVSEVRAAAIWSIGQFGEARHAAVLMEAMADPDFEVRSNAGWGLVRLGRGVLPEVQRIALGGPCVEAQEMARFVVAKIDAFPR